jgi:hypothetical protein
MKPKDTQETHHDKKGKLNMEPGGTGKALSSQPEQDGLTQRALQFVNTTGSVILDEASRMEIRAQVMRDWHRRKNQQSISNNPAAHGADGSGASGSATTSSTYKFKLGRRNLLPRPPTSSRPRIRPKDGPSVEFEQERDLSLRRHENTVVDAATTPQNRQVMQTATAGYQSQDKRKELSNNGCSI